LIIVFFDLIQVVQVDYNPQVIDTRKILEVFFALHNPTELNRQGADVGTQYRSVIFYHDDEQKNIAQEIIKELTASKAYEKSIVTELSKIEKFFPAEDYHQNYFDNNPNQGYCMAVVRPKIDKFKKLFKDIYH
jgi:peptide-methionine (S)-S-oxide reductase